MTIGATHRRREHTFATTSTDVEISAPRITTRTEAGSRVDGPRRDTPVDGARRLSDSPDYAGRDADTFSPRSDATDLSRASALLDLSKRGTAKDGLGAATATTGATGSTGDSSTADDTGSASTSPVAARVPDGDTLGERAAAHLGSRGGRAMAVELEDHAASFGVPEGGFSGQTNLYGESGMPVAWYALRGALGTDGARGTVSDRAADRLSGNLTRAAMVTDDPALALAVTMREHPSSWTASTGRVETFSEGGLDYMGDHLGDLTRRVPPEAMTGAWRRGPAIISGETGEEVHPASIPAADQLVAYAAELERAEERFETLVREVYGDRADEALASLSPDERRAWTQFTFGRPGRTHAADTAISDRSFSANAALELLRSEGTMDLGAILTDARFEGNASIRRA
ncbi:hypothetical protein L6R52_42630, partial [Myxococcota bacterium]|nr:hypothetical protein [Myxococcota bacterium]